MTWIDIFEVWYFSFPDWQRDLGSAIVVILAIAGYIVWCWITEKETK